jgi:hypothetical protein
VMTLGRVVFVRHRRTGAMGGNASSLHQYFDPSTNAVGGGYIIRTLNRSLEAGRPNSDRVKANAQ